MALPRKREARKSVSQPGWITLDGGFAARPCLVQDLSVTGARISLDDAGPLIDVDHRRSWSPASEPFGLRAVARDEPWLVHAVMWFTRTMSRGRRAASSTDATR